MKIINIMISNTGFWIISGAEFEKEHCYDPKLAPKILEFLKTNNIKTMYDFGCGNGLYTKLFNYNGVQCVGYDGNPITSRLENCKIQDITDPTFRIEKVDCVMCLEVGEHIPEEYESNLITCIDYHIKKGGYAIVSWAIPGQGGLGHVNCRNNSYVIDKFYSLGYDYLKIPSQDLRDNSYHSWFKNTIMVFKKN